MNFQVSDDLPTRILPVGNGLAVVVNNVPSNALIQVKVKYRKKVWSSVFESTDSLGINMFASAADE